MIPTAIKNKLAVANVLSALLANPQLAIDDRFVLTPDDFPERFHKIIFGAIQHVVHAGARHLDEVVIDDYLSQYPAQHKVFEENGGIEYLQHALELTSSSNYEYYYTLLKKCSLLNQLEERGFDIRKFHDPHALDVATTQNSQSNLDQYSLADILDHYDIQLTSLKSSYCSDSDVVACHISKGMRELKRELTESPAWGLPMNSAFMTTICHGRRLKKFYLKSMASGTGKALTNSTLIPTYERGWQRVDNIRPGDKLIGRNGLPTTVLAVHPQPQPKQVYRVTFEDGRTVDCCKEHLWSITGRENRPLTTEQLYMRGKARVKPFRKQDDSDWAYRIPLCKPVQYAPRLYNTPPDIMGMFLARLDSRVSIDYLLGSVQQRLEFLQGLWDEKGDVDAEGNVCFLSNSKPFCQSLLRLVQSLGLIGVLKVKKVNLTDEIHYTVSVRASEIGLAVVNIEPLGKYENMTCFTVDAPDALFLCGDYIVTHNTRISMADACRLAISQYYDPDKQSWVKTACEASVLFITTELELSEIQTMLWAYVACVPEDHITDNKYEPGEEDRVQKAIEIVEQSKFYSVYIANFDMEDIENIIKRHRLQYGVEYVFHDYIFTSAKIFTELSTKARGFKLREDQSLMVFSDKLKSLCNKYGIHIDSSTQTNDEWRTIKNPDQSVIRGARAIADKVDIGYIGLEPSEKDKEAIQKIMPYIGMSFNQQPNLVYHVYKVRRGKYNHVKVFVHFDYGTLRTTDMFVTDRDYKLLDIKRTNIELLLEQTDTTEDVTAKPSERAEFNW